MALFNLSAWAYEHDKYWLTDLIDTFRGSNHCEKQWDKLYDTPPTKFEQSEKEYKKNK